MNDDGFDVSVVIVSYNTKELLASCLRSIFTQSPNLKLEIFVIDNASTDDSVTMLREEFATTHLITNKENVGFAKATNQGIRASSGRYILLLNPDTLILDHAIERMVNFMDSQPQIGACGCKLVYPDGTFQRSALPFPSLIGGIHEYSALFERIPFLGYRIALDWMDPKPDETRPMEYCSGACLLVSRTCVNNVGLLDESFFLYTEEVDWCKRMWQANWPVYYFADARVVHYLGASQEGFGLSKRRLQILRSNLYYLRKWHGPMYTRVYQVIVWLCSLYRYCKRQLSLLCSTDETGFLLEEIAFYRAILASRFEATALSKGRTG